MNFKTLSMVFLCAFVGLVAGTVMLADDSSEADAANLKAGTYDPETNIYTVTTVSTNHGVAFDIAALYQEYGSIVVDYRSATNNYYLELNLVPQKTSSDTIYFKDIIFLYGVVPCDTRSLGSAYFPYLGDNGILIYTLPYELNSRHPINIPPVSYGPFSSFTYNSNNYACVLDSVNCSVEFLPNGTLPETLIDGEYHRWYLDSAKTHLLTAADVVGFIDEPFSSTIYHTVQFNIGDSTLVSRPSTQCVDEGLFATQPTLRVTGYTFEWCTDSELQHPFSFSLTSPTSNMTLYLKAERIHFEVIWNVGNYDVTAPATQTIFYGEKIPMPEITFEDRTVFWYTDENLVYQWDFDYCIVTSDLDMYMDLSGNSTPTGTTASQTITNITEQAEKVVYVFSDIGLLIFALLLVGLALLFFRRR